MIRAIWSDFPSFKKIQFRPGFNLVVAERSQESSEKDSRNGLGKSSVCAIIKFLLGSSGLTKIANSPLADSFFYLHVLIGTGNFVVARSQSDAGRIRVVEGPAEVIRASGIDVDESDGVRTIAVKDWVRFLGEQAFDLPPVREEYSPSFGSLIGYFMRSGKEAFVSPFVHNAKQFEWDKQVNNAYLLGLEWHDPQRFQLIRDREKAIKSLKEVSDLGIVLNFLGKRGELEAERARLSDELSQLSNALSSFEVASQYADVEEDADEITAAINGLSNDNYSARLLLTDYQEAIKETIWTDYLSVNKIYEDAGAAFQLGFRRTLAEVNAFHEHLISNRRAYLETEIRRLSSDIGERENEIRKLDERRCKIMRVLEQNNALAQYGELHSRSDATRERLARLNAQLENLEQVETAKAQLKVEEEVLRQDMLLHYNERRSARDIAVTLFNSASEHLYEVPGDLIIEVAKRGFSFAYKIQRKGSEGVDNAAIFCYDLALAELWSKRSSLPVLVHDSGLFDPIEERQLAHALEYASVRAEACGFQYICMLNTDRIPRADLATSFPIEESVVARFSDKNDSGGLFGIRF